MRDNEGSLMSGWDFVTLGFGFGFGFGKPWLYLVPDCAARNVSQLLRIHTKDEEKRPTWRETAGMENGIMEG
jgi:hypothetical protein